MEKILLIGGGGHCKVVIDAISLEKKYKTIGIIDLKDKIGTKVLDVPIVGTDSDIEEFLKKGIKNYFIAVGTIGNPDLKIKIFNLFKKRDVNFPNIIHPAALVSKSAQLGEGNYIAAGAIINAGTKIGNHCIINTGAIIDHDCKIGDFVHISPGVAMSGGVVIGKYTHVGTGCSIKQYLEIGKNSIIGVGSVVVDNIEKNVIAYGNPCRKIRKNA